MTDGGGDRRRDGFKLPSGTSNRVVWRKAEDGSPLYWAGIDHSDPKASDKWTAEITKAKRVRLGDLPALVARFPRWPLETKEV
jgi:hypothetical protein